jgi:hypothetical protein
MILLPLNSVELVMLLGMHLRYVRDCSVQLGAVLCATLLR